MLGSFLKTQQERTKTLLSLQTRRPIPFTLYREYMENVEHNEHRRTGSTAISS